MKSFQGTGLPFDPVFWESTLEMRFHVDDVCFYRWRPGAILESNGEKGLGVIIRNTAFDANQRERKVGLILMLSYSVTNLMHFEVCAF